MARRPRPPLVAAEPEAPATVLVRCIVHDRPHTGVHTLHYGEAIELSADVAEALLKRGAVEIV